MKAKLTDVYIEVNPIFAEPELPLLSKAEDIISVVLPLLGAIKHTNPDVKITFIGPESNSHEWSRLIESYRGALTKSIKGFVIRPCSHFRSKVRSRALLLSAKSSSIISWCEGGGAALFWPHFSNDNSEGERAERLAMLSIDKL